MVASIFFQKHKTEILSENMGECSLKFEESRDCMRVMAIRLKRLFKKVNRILKFPNTSTKLLFPLNRSFVEYSHLPGDD